MADDWMCSVAAAYVDDSFREQQQNLVLSHRRQERYWLDHHKIGLRESAQRREDAEWQHAQRLRSIENRRDRIADRLHRQHNSIAGRFEAMTRQGRARQTERLEQLDNRMRQLQVLASRRHAIRLKRHDEAQQRERIFVARSIKFMRLDNLEQRQQHTLNHRNNRDRLVDDQVRAIVRVQAREQKHELALKNQWTQAQERQHLGKTRKLDSLNAEWQAAQKRQTLRDSFQQAQGQSLKLRRI